MMRRKISTMDYFVTFEDGSEALMHYGVKGMKWGVHNAETAARYGESRSVAKSRERYEKAKRSRGPLSRLRKQRALNRYADALIKDNQINSESFTERERRRASKEKEADKLLSITPEKDGNEKYHRSRDEYYKQIRDLEFSRAVEKASPKGREAVKKVINPTPNRNNYDDLDNFVSPKAAAASEGIPIKTKQEAKRYRELRNKYNAEHAKWYRNEPNEYDKVAKDYSDFEERQLKKYVH